MDGPAVARRINGLIKHAILPVMQSLSMPRASEHERKGKDGGGGGGEEKEASFVPRHYCTLVRTLFGLDHATGLVPLPFYMLDYIRFSRYAIPAGTMHWEIMRSRKLIFLIVLRVFTSTVDPEIADISSDRDNATITGVIASLTIGGRFVRCANEKCVLFL